MEKGQKWVPIAKDYNSYYLRSYIWTMGINRGGKIVPELKNFTNTLAIRSREGAIEYLAELPQWREMHQVFISKLREDIGFLRQVINDTNVVADKAMVRGREIFDSNLKEASNEELLAHLNELAALQMDIYSYGVLLPLLDLNEQSFVEKNVKDFLIEKVPAEKVTEYFLAITTPTEETFALQQEKALLRLSIACAVDAELKQIILDNDIEKALEIIVSDFNSFYKQLRAHTKKYGWVYYSFVGPAYTEKDFLAFIKDNLIDDKISPQEKLSKIEAGQVELAKKKEEIIKELNPDQFYKELLEIAGTFVWAKPTRKDYQSQLYFYIIDGVLAEIARRLGITITQALSCPFEVLAEALGGKKLDLSILETIYKYHVVVPVQGGVKLYYGKELAEISPLIQEEETKDYSAIRELKGTTACKGQARGVVRIINKPEDMGKMQDGDILVSVATTPSIVPAMKKAAAIISDEGGLTCHAAIVSRELGTPCVVGTKIATKVLKDGDLVEVDADKGVVRKI